MTNTSPLGQNPMMPGPINTNPIPNAPVNPAYPISHEPATPEVIKPVIDSIPTSTVNQPITSPLNTVTEPIPFDSTKTNSNTFTPQNNVVITNDLPGNKPKGKTNAFFVIVIILFIIALITVVAMIVLNGSKLTNLNPTPTPSVTIEPTGVITDNSNTDNTVITGVEINPMITEVTTESRLKITSPLSFQVVPKEGTVITIKGEMKGFFEGVMNFRIVDERYFEIANGIITAQGDNLIGFVPFEKKFTIPNFADSFAVRGMLEFSETSMKDGVNIVVASIPLVFK